MTKIKSKWKLLLYALSGLGVNMLNIIVTSYLCDALMVEGFKENIENWTYFNKTIVVAGVWSICILISRVLDGIIDIPFSTWGENIKCKFGKRRPVILFGLVLTMLSYVLFLNPLHSHASILNTIYMAIILCSFYAFYTLTMVTFYATFAEVVDNSNDRLLLSNFKSTFDVVYFIFGYALIPALIGSTNIRIIAYIFLPLALTMLIPMFLLKEESTLDNKEKVKALSIKESLVYSIKNKKFVKWMITYVILQFGIQMFLTGQNVYCSGVAGFDAGTLAILNACSFAPVPFTLIIYNKLINKKGFKFGFIFALSMFTIGMTFLTICNKDIIANLTIRTIVGVISALFCSFGIGALFSVEYVIPATLAANEKKEKGISNPGMYFAVSGLVGGIVSGISTGLVWINLKNYNLVFLMSIIVLVCCIISAITVKFLPQEIDNIGKKEISE